jgi:dephospho-CoA kinase
MKILNNFKKIQLSLDFKRKKSQFIIKNNFKKNFVKIKVKEIIKNLI